MDSLIAAVREQEEAARFLAWPGDFDLDRGEHVEEVHLASGAALEGFAGGGAGGTLSSDPGSYDLVTGVCHSRSSCHGAG
jgi:hypothetical protein